uniref:Orotate phosphoribosyltransferase n=1 Tax=Diaphorobacter sp. PCA039 TaxID=266831 RepID=C0KGN6_9BURK|nr:orotate phosphoribosyltransferase [Diaphorobacter sp. PCA039]
MVHVLPILGGLLLAVEGDRNGMRRGTRGADQRDGFARGGAGAHHVVDDEHLALKRRAHQRAALAMVLGLFAVVGKGHVLAQPRQLHRHRGGQRNAFVGGAEDHVELDAAGHQGLCIELRQPPELGAVVEQTGVEEIRAQAACLGLEFTKAQHP